MKKYEWHDKAVELYKQGLVDREIAEQCGVSRKTISNFRKSLGFTSHTSERTENWREMCMTLYHAGLNDTQISVECGVTPGAVAHWRSLNNLQSNARIASDLWQKEAAKMYKSGAHDREISEAFGVTESAVKNWRVRNSLPSHNRRFRIRLTWHKKAKELHDLGEPDKIIAEQCNVPVGTVKSWRKKYGYKANAPMPIKHEFPWHELALRLYNEGFPRQEIAKHCEVSPDMITYWRNKNNLPRFKNVGGSTHGACRRHKDLYIVWRNMLKRCEDPTSEKYISYGARGISVCNEWHDPNKFIDWALVNGYQKGLQIDRKDNNGNYQPSNCRFVTNTENQRNRRSNRTIIVDGNAKCIAEWAEITKTKSATIFTWLNVHGMKYAEMRLSQKLKEE